MSISQKQICITRPSSLGLLKRTIEYNNVRYGMDLRKLTYEQGKRLCEIVFQTVGLGSSYNAISTLVAVCRSKTQVVVAKQVSRSLEVSRVVGDISALIWPADAMEISFEDNALPSVLIKRGRYLDNRDCVVFVCFTKDDGQISCALSYDEWKQYLDMGVDSFAELPVRTGSFCQEMAQSDDEKSALSYMIRLCVLVIAYASVPVHKPEPQKASRAVAKAIGLHPKHVMPGGTIMAVRYLPRIVQDGISNGIEEAANSHRFLGRAGHVRYYNDERYKAVRGTWQWMPPIPPPDGVKIIYKVRSAPGTPISP